MKFIISSLLSIVALSLNISAQDLSMIISKDALRTYAVQQSAMVQSSIGTSLPSGPDPYAITPVESATAQGILDTIRHRALSIEIVNPKDQIYTWAFVTNADYDFLFSGNNSFYLVASGGTYVLPLNYGEMTLELGSEIPLPIGDVDSAIVTKVDATGRSVGSNMINVRNKKAYFPSALAGKNYVLSIHTSVNGISKWTNWNVLAGTKIQPTTYNTPVSPTIDGMIALKDSEINLTIPTSNGYGKNRTVEYKSTVNQQLQVTFVTSEGKSFKGIQFRNANTAKFTELTAVYNTSLRSMTVTLTLQAGSTYYIIPLWNDGDLIVPVEQWYPPSYYETTTTTTVGQG